MSNELQILDQNIVVQAFTKQGGIDELFDRVASEVRKEVPDVTTDKGRKAIGSLAAKVSKTKKLIEEAGKALVADQKAQIKLIDDDRIAVVKKFEGLFREVLAPRDVYEQQEKQRVETLQLRVDGISAPCEFESSHFIKSHIEYIKSIEIDDSFMEFKDKAKLAKFEKLETLNELLIITEKKEAEQAELEKQRIAEQERLQREYEEKIALEATQKAQREADEKARFEAERVEREKKEALEKAQREKLEADQREAKLKLEKEQAELREAQLKQKAIDDAKQAEINKQKAIEAERNRIEQEAVAKAKAEKEAEEARQANKEHRQNICNDILLAFSKLGIGDELGKEIIKAIHKGEVPNISIKF